MTDLPLRFTAAVSDRYRLERELGRGGMATVHLAHDVRHDRKVALKVLRPELSAILGTERFLQEIRTTANLQHPHVLPLHDSGEVDGTIYYVMPYVEGESLRERLTREKQLPVPEAVRIATEVASALDYAHRRGVIHRDIKPENILLHDGRALVADFGIALAVSTVGGTRLTETGLSIGTPAYMSPEQAMGERDLTARSDVYALGCVLYEMLVGEPPFTGPTAQAIVAKVITAEPVPPHEMRRTVPPHVARVTLTALEKLPADRFPTAAALADALADEAYAAVASKETAAPGHRVGARRVAFALGSAVLVAAGGWYLGYSSGRDAARESPPSRLALLVPNLGGSGAGNVNRQVALMPDGAAVVFYAQPAAGGGRIHAQRLHEETATPIPGTEAVYAPLVSPDGRWLAARNRSLDAIRMPIAGGVGEPTVLARGPAFYAWHPDGSLWITSAPFRSMERFAPGSDTPEVMLDGFDAGVVLQQILPDGRTALVIETTAGTASGPCAVLDLETSVRTPLVPTQVTAVRYTRGHLVYAEPSGNLIAHPFDAGARGLTGGPVTLATGVSVTGAGDAQFDVAANGTIIYVPEEPRSLVLVDAVGVARPATPERHGFHMPRFSPDGRRLSVDFGTPDGRDVWVLDLEQQVLTRVTFDRDGHDATWTPDGRALTYGSNRAGDLGIFRVRPGSGAPPESLLVSPALAFSGEWLRDGSGLVTVALNLRPGSQQDIGIVRNGGRGPIEPLVASPFQENYPALSPDGRWVAFVSDQSGRPQVYVRPVAGEGGEVQVSRGGGDEPVWAASGREVYYRDVQDDGAVLAAARIETTPAFRVLGRRVLFAIDGFVPTTPHANYDVAPDGRTFAMVHRNPASRIVVLQNLPALVRQLTGRAGR